MIHHFLAISVLFVMAMACNRVPPAPFGSGLPKVAATPEVHSMERAMFQRLNRDRNANGLPSLVYDERLADVARYHSADMRDHKFFDHDSRISGSLDNRLNRAGYLFAIARENLSEAPDVNTSQDGLLKSPGHHANIMSPDVTHVGVGIVKGGVMDPRNFLFTQVFAKQTHLQNPAAAQQAVLKVINQQRAARHVSPIALHPVLTRLATEHIDEVDPNDGGRSLERVGKEVSEQAAGKMGAGFTGVMLAGQLLVDSGSFVVPGPLLDKKVQLGLAVRKAPNEIGRPMLQVLMVIAR